MHFDDLFVIFRHHRRHYQERRRPLGVSHIVKLFDLSRLQHMVDHSRNVVDSNLMPRKVPILSHIISKISMFATVPISSSVSQPNIIPLVRQKIWQSILRSDHDPIPRRSQQSVHQQHRRFPRIKRSLRWRCPQPVHHHKESVIRLNLMGLRPVTVLDSDLWLQINPN